MPPSKFKSFAQTARRDLKEQIELRLDFVLRTDSAELRQRAPQVKTLKKALAQEGRDVLVERVAYTWFNRLTALRFMDANGYHPFGARVVTAAGPQETLPEVLQQARAGVLDADLRAQLDTAETFDGVLSGKIPTTSKEGSAYRMLLVAACHYYHRLMPFLFEKIGDATELLLPEDLLTEHSVVNPFRTELTHADCRDVEVIGWLYQFYISEKKDAVMARNAPVPKEDIPAVTQLFTPHWIVRYLVENSLGRLWLLNRPASRLRDKMPYYIEGAAETDFLKIAKPEEIRLLDPAGGSGHLLTYAYDLLYAIYEEEGYDAPEIPGYILKHNLFGLDICDRAAALAAFALVMKARGSDNRFFRRVVQPNQISLQEVHFAEGELSAYFKVLGTQPSALHPKLVSLLHQFEEAKNYGSLIQPCLIEAEIRAVRDQLLSRKSAVAEAELMIVATHANIIRVLEQAEYLCQRYSVVVANPPYQEQDDMNPDLGVFIGEHFAEGKTDLCCAFMMRNQTLAKPQGFVAMITMQSWMFLAGSVDLRSKFLPSIGLRSMLHLGPRSFDSIGGEVVQTTAFVGCNSRKDSKPIFHRLVEGESEAEKEKLFLARTRVYTGRSFSDFRLIPGSPVAYWATEAAIRAFTVFPALASFAEPRQGLITGDSARFLRNWHEVSIQEIGFGIQSREKARETGRKWFPQDKGGPPRRWYGNNDYLVNWLNDGEEVRNLKTQTGRIKSRPQNLDYYFRPGVTWSAVSTAGFACRVTGHGFIFSNAGMKVFHADQDVIFHIAAFLNSKVADMLLGLLSETINYDQGSIARLPVARINGSALLASELIALSQSDWNNSETSWEFRELPFLRTELKGSTLQVSWQNWKGQCDAAVLRMQELETENNRQFIAAYGLQAELSPEVPENQVTLGRANLRKDIAAFCSYAIGCMMGRYSLDQPGLILADTGATVAGYLACVPEPSFAPDADGILPMLDGEWFADDVVAQFREFVRTCFGAETLSENLMFIEASLGSELRKYFTKGYYRDHLKTYKKRPIYWMVSSPEGSFQALIYLHRYTRDTINLLLNNYVREFLHKLEARAQELTAVTLNESSRSGERTKATKELGKIEKMLKEIRTWERDVVLPLAQQRINLDLDDGVKVNYQKFPGLLVPIPGLEKKEEE